MAFRCMECAGDLRNMIMLTTLGDIDVWFCDDCGVYYDKKEPKGIIFSQ